MKLFPRLHRQTQNYIICTSQRSGKTWLATTLRELGFGYADEFVTALLRNQLGLAEAFEAGGLPGFVQRLKDLQSGCSFGTALAWNDFEKFARRTETEPRELFEQFYSQMGSGTVIIYLRREDLLDQAISHYLMRFTGYRHSYDDAAKKTARTLVQFDRQAISDEIKYAERAYSEWERVLTGMTFHEITYEKFVADPTKTVKDILQLLGARASEAKIKRCLKVMTKVGDQKNAELRGAYLQAEEGIPNKSCHQ